MDKPTEVKVDAVTLQEMNIHLGYMKERMDENNKRSADALLDIKTQITNLAEHYITAQEFLPVEEGVKKNALKIEGLTTWKDTLTGKIIGISSSIAFIFTILGILANVYFKH